MYQQPGPSGVMQRRKQKESSKNLPEEEFSSSDEKDSASEIDLEEGDTADEEEGSDESSTALARKSRYSRKSKKGNFPLEKADEEEWVELFK